MKKAVGKVTIEEKDEIQSLFERRNGLVELSKIIGADDALYEKVVADMGATSTKFQNWWDRTSAKYQWESSSQGHWEIDFDDCSVYLVE